MNKHILLVMKWLNDKSSVTQAELIANKTDAFAAYAFAAYVDVAAYAFAAYVDVAADAVAYAAADVAADAAYAFAECQVKRYFALTGEDRQIYINELEKI